MEHSEQERLQSITKQLLEYKQVLAPQWKHMVELANHQWEEKEEILSAAQHRAEEMYTKRREAEFAYQVLEKRVKSLTESNEVKEESTESGNTTLECAKEQWNKISDNLAKCNANIAEYNGINHQMEDEITRLDQENVALRKELTLTNERKRVQETGAIGSRKRLKDLEEKGRGLETRNKDLTRKLEQLCDSTVEGSYFHNLQLIHQSLSLEIQLLSAVNKEISLQDELEHTILAETEVAMEEEVGKLLVLRAEKNWYDEEILQLDHQIQQVGDEDEMDKMAIKEPRVDDWTPETKELLHECVCLKNKNTHIAKNIKQMKMERSKLLVTNL